VTGKTGLKSGWRRLLTGAVASLLALSTLGLGVVSQSGPRHHPTEAPPEQDILFQADMDNPAGNYGFATNLTVAGTINYLPTGGHAGGPAMQFVPDKTRPDENQYQMGFGTGSLGHTFDLDEGYVYLRWRMRFDDAYRWSDAGRIKFFQIGQSDQAPGTLFSRIIGYLDRPGADNKVATLGARNYVPPFTYGDGGYYPNGIPSYFGLGGISNDWSNAGGAFGSIRAVVNIGNFAGGPVLLHHGNRSPAVAPGPNSTAPSNGWYHLQVRLQAGTGSNAHITWWVNNNDEENPTNDMTWYPDSGLQEDAGFSTDRWGNGVTVGGYMDEQQNTGQDYVLEDFVVALTYDAEWFPE
jgi:hypothetical protein